MNNIAINFPLIRSKSGRITCTRIDGLFEIGFGRSFDG